MKKYRFGGDLRSIQQQQKQLICVRFVVVVVIITNIILIAAIYYTTIFDSAIYRLETQTDGARDDNLLL